MNNETVISQSYASLPQAVEALCLKVFGVKPMYLVGMWDGFPTPTEESLREHLDFMQRDNYRLRCCMIEIAEALGIHNDSTLDHHVIAEVKRVKERLRRLANAADVLWEEHKAFSLECNGAEGMDQFGSDSEGHYMIQALVDATLSAANPCQETKHTQMNTSDPTYFDAGPKVDANTPITSETEMVKICAIVTGHCPSEICTTAEAVQWLVDRHKAATAANLKLDEIRTEKLATRGLADEANAVSAARLILRKSKRIADEKADGKPDGQEENETAQTRAQKENSMTNRTTYRCEAQSDGKIVCTPATEEIIARRSAADCSPDDLQVRDAFAAEVFVADYSGQRYSGSNFADIESARAWLTLQPNRDSLRVALTAKFILDNADVDARRDKTPPRQEGGSPLRLTTCSLNQPEITNRLDKWTK